MTTSSPRPRRGKQTRAEINAAQRAWRRRWKREHPDQYREMLEREREARSAREREAYAALTDAEKQARLDRWTAYTDRIQAESQQRATNMGIPYTEDDDALVMSPDLPDREIAAKLGRTLLSVRSRRKNLRRAKLSRPAP